MKLIQVSSWLKIITSGLRTTLDIISNHMLHMFYDRGELATVYMFDKVIASFSLLIHKNLHKVKIDVNWHAQFRSRHVLWLVKENKHTSIDTLESEMTRLTMQLECCKLQLKYLENITHKKLNLKTLDAHMWVSLCGLEVYAMDWETTSSTFGETCKTEGYLCLVDSFFLLQIKIAKLIIQNISFPKILCKQYWGDILE